MYVGVCGLSSTFKDFIGVCGLLEKRLHEKKNLSQPLETKAP